MERKIARLSEIVINQIAAGEVVENPASVVKELVENSLDAQASRIEVAIHRGGLESIRIDDNGCGMSDEDALLSLERHATSKIRSSEDLFELMTMGFRGEALAAVAAISHLEMKTSLGTVGTEIKMSGGKMISVEPTARNRGTTIEVKSLFHNVPARKKFQKSISALTAQVRRSLETIALAHPEVAFSFYVDGNAIFELLASEKKKRVEDLLGAFAHEGKKESMWGLFGAPHEAKSHRRNQYVYINRRPVFSPLLSNAVKEGYGTRIKENEHPSFILFLELDPQLLDVNVHPQKKEVRFSEESILFHQIRSFSSSVFEKVVFEEPLSFEPSAISWAPLAEEPPSFPAPRFQEKMALPFSFPERPIAVFKSYLLLEREGLLLIDLEAAQARIVFEKEGKIIKRSSSSYSLDVAIEIWEALQKCHDVRYDPVGKIIWKEVTEQDFEKILVGIG